MVSKVLAVALLATAVAARPQHAHKHSHFHGSGTAPIRPTGTGAPFGTGNSTGPYINGTGTGVPKLSTSTVANVVTMTVVPLPVSSGASSIAANNQAASSAATCAGSQSTTTITTTEMVTVTLDESSTTSTPATSSAAVSSPAVSSPVVVSSSPASSPVSSSASSAAGAAGGEFYGASSSSSSSSSRSSAVAATSQAPSSTVQASPSVAGTSTSSAASATVSTSSGTSSSSKRGLAYNEASLTELWSGKPVSWAYNWGSTSGGTVGTGLEYVPMAWCPGSISVSDWTSDAETAIAAGSSHLLGFNEPDQPTQCNIAASEAATQHQAYMNPLSSKAQIGSPAVTNGGGTMGLNYLSSFFTSCAGACKVDFLNIHWYGSGTGAIDDFKNHTSSAIELAQQNGISKVWVTEFALNGADAADTTSFLSEALPWLDSQDMVERYAFFMCSDGLLTDGNAISSQIGAAYVAV